LLNKRLILYIKKGGFPAFFLYLEKYSIVQTKNIKISYGDNNNSGGGLGLGLGLHL
jgi:hypothetical protein